MNKTLRTIALISALCWTAASLDSLRDPSVQTYRDALVLAPWLMTGAVLTGVHLLQHHRTGRAAAAGLAVALLGIALGTAGNVGAVLGQEALAVIAFPGGPLCFLAGLALFGAATVRARVLPAWTGVLIALSQPNAMLIGLALSWHAPLQPHGSYTGALGHALAMLAVAAGLTVAGTRRPAVETAA
jgi:hypothetical protein